MRRFTLRLFGIPVLSVDVDEFQYVDEEDVESPAVGGGSAHNFQLAEPWLDERYLPWEEDDSKHFGFGAL